MSTPAVAFLRFLSNKGFFVGAFLFEFEPLELPFDEFEWIERVLMILGEARTAVFAFVA